MTQTTGYHGDDGAVGPVTEASAAETSAAGTSATETSATETSTTGTETASPVGAFVAAGDSAAAETAVADVTPESNSDDEAAEAVAPSATGPGTEVDENLVAEGDAAGDYLERLLDILDYDGDIDLDVEGERAVVSIVGDGDVERLVGEDGKVLGALQELTRLAAGLETGTRSRLMLDIAGYRAKRKAELTELGRTTAEKVVASGEPVRLGAMNPFERKVVHDAVAAVEGATSASEGEEPRRRVIVQPLP